MRVPVLLALLPLIAACEAEQAPPPEPRATIDPVVVKTEADRKVLLSGDPGPRDFKVSFGDPFVRFENRDTRMAINQNAVEPKYRIIEVTRSLSEGVTVFRANEGVVPGGEPFILTVMYADCVNQFTRERTGYIAWLGTEDNPREVWSCAARAQ